MPAFFTDPIGLIALLLVSTYIAGQIAQQVGVPQIVGYIIGGLILGPSILRVFPVEFNSQLGFVSQIALALIGANLGSSLKFRELRAIGWKLPLIFACEAVLVLLLVWGGAYIVTGELTVALIFGSLAVATAPGATMETMREYKCKGPVTTISLALTALDGGLAIILFSTALAIAQAVAGGAALSAGVIIGQPLLIIGLSTGIGFGMGMLVVLVSRILSRSEQLIPLIGVAAFVIAGLSRVAPIQVVLTALAMGTTIVNVLPRYSGLTGQASAWFGVMIFPLFFGLAGARLNLGIVPSLGALGVVYILGRNVGKFAGSWLGGTLAGFAPVVKSNIGIALFSQAGIVIGLALQAQEVLGQAGTEGMELGALILNAITAVVLVLLVTGPLFVKLAVSRAGEVGMDAEPAPG